MKGTGNWGRSGLGGRARKREQAPAVQTLREVRERASDEGGISDQIGTRKGGLWLGSSGLRKGVTGSCRYFLIKNKYDVQHIFR